MRRYTELSEHLIMFPHRQSSRGDAGELSLEQMASQIVEQWPTLYELLFGADTADVSQKREHGAMRDFYLLICFWCYASTSNQDIRTSFVVRSHKLVQSRSGPYITALVLVHFDNLPSRINNSECYDIKKTILRPAA